MFEILNGRGSFWQWDINQKIVVQDLPNGAEVHFSNGNSDYALVTLVKTVDGKKVCDVPNVVLQKAGYVNVFAYVIDGEEKYTEYKAAILVLARPKPEDYIYTETETLCYKDLYEKIGDVSKLKTTAKNDIVSAVNEVAEKAESAQNSALPPPTSSDNGKFLGCENGKAAWLPVASGGGEKIVFNETVLASGTIPEGLEAWKAFFEGVITVAELKKWKKFLLVVVAGTSTNIQIGVDNTTIFTSVNAKQHYIEFEWLDSEKTVIDIQSITGDAGIAIRDDTGYYAKPGVYLPTLMSSISFRTSINKRIIAESYNNNKLKLVVNNAQTADGAWTLHGLLQ